MQTERAPKQGLEEAIAEERLGPDGHVVWRAITRRRYPEPSPILPDPVQPSRRPGVVSCAVRVQAYLALAMGGLLIGHDHGAGPEATLWGYLAGSVAATVLACGLERGGR